MEGHARVEGEMREEYKVRRKGKRERENPVEGIRGSERGAEQGGTFCED